ncbi:MAG: phosphoribosylamine--glycine ligase, partial [Cyclobacteriaceae bacterium]|nr:phosphoribosylamine--glycine ligase [Cyclobacteriaceae bacterium]
MNILVIGSGGREHTLAWKIKQSKKCDTLYVAPGNAGTALIANNVNISDFNEIADFCIKKNIEMIVVGPEGPLVEGFTDFITSSSAYNHIKVIGPSKKGAQLEGSKDFSKAFMNKYGIPAAKSKTFTVAEINEAKEYIASYSPPIVLKADGLAAGKGVIIAESVAEAQSSIENMLVNKQFGEASSKVLVEEFLEGIELSVFVLTDGDNFVILPEAKDYKRIGEGDTGPNTGGMGAVSPVSFANDGFMKKVKEKVIIPTISGLKSDNIDYKGFIFIGLMNVNGEPYVIEYNVRMGDPETEAVIPRIKNDIIDLFEKTANSELENTSLEIDERVAATVVLVSEGYPERYNKGEI